MRRSTWIVVSMVMVMCAAVVLAEGSMDKKAAPAKSSMQMFLIESPHTEEECMAVMDETNKMKELEKWSWGCMTGNHTAYRMVKAKDEAAALAMVPAEVRGKAKAISLMNMTPAMLQNAHKSHM